jgi:hypothetical protein
MAEHSTVRLELFFFDELVQAATQSLLFLESHQGSNSVPGADILQFDFGKSRQVIVDEQKKCRDNMRYSVLSPRVENSLMKKQGSFLFHSYQVPDVSEIRSNSRASAHYFSFNNND